MTLDDDRECAAASAALQDGDAGRRNAALATLYRLAEAGHAEAQFQLGLYLARSGGDAVEAARWCTQAAHQGCAPAQFNLALLHAAGRGVAQDPDAADHWLRLSAANGVPEAESCLELIHRDDAARPATWSEAETRASVALDRTDPDTPKSLRFIDYYTDPCIDLLIRRFRLTRALGEEIVREFFREFEAPLAEGAHDGRTRKEALRTGFVGDGAFRPYFARVVESFARDYLRRGAEAPAPAPVPEEELEQAVARYAPQWRALLDRFLAAVGGTRADAARAARVLDARLRGAVVLDPADERGQRPDLRFAAELLGEWLHGTLVRHHLDDELTLAGLQLLPDWLHEPSGSRRARALLYLALVERRLARA